jgi:DNA-binding Xre family transcriptional regulator
MKPLMAQERQLVQELKLVLREQGLRYRDAARALALSEASVKRLFSRGGFTLERLAALCALAGIEITDLAERVQRRAPAQLRLTRAQEQEIVEDPKLLLVAWLVLNRWRSSDILATFALEQRELQRCLIRLDRLRLIELQPGNRVRLRARGDVTWQGDGPLQRHIHSVMLREFLAGDFGVPGATLHLHGTILSAAGLAQVQRLLQRALRDCQAVSEQDEVQPFGERHGAAIVLAARPWQYSGFRRYAR